MCRICSTLPARLRIACGAIVVVCLMSERVQTVSCPCARRACLCSNLPHQNSEQTAARAVEYWKACRSLSRALLGRMCRYHCSLFFSAGELTEAWSWVLMGIALSQIVGGPLASGTALVFAHGAA